MSTAKKIIYPFKTKIRDMFVKIINFSLKLTYAIKFVNFLQYFEHAVTTCEKSKGILWN